MDLIFPKKYKKKFRLIWCILFIPTAEAIGLVCLGYGGTKWDEKEDWPETKFRANPYLVCILY